MTTITNVVKSEYVIQFQYGDHQWHDTHFTDIKTIEQAREKIRSQNAPNGYSFRIVLRETKETVVE